MDHGRMSDVRGRWWGALVVLVAMASSRSAGARAIAVQRPDAADPVLVESFSRLCGELSMYGFEARVFDAPAEASPSDEAATKVVPFSDVLGGVAMTREAGRASARIWLAPSGQRKEIVWITIDVSDEDAPSLLAIRAADLLHLGLRDESRASAGPVSAGTGRAVAALRSEPSTPARPSDPGIFGPWRLAMGAVGLWDATRLGLGWAPFIQGGARLTSRISLEGAWIGPVVGHSVSSGGATARVREEMINVAVALTLGTMGRMQVEVFEGVGAMHLTVHGETQALTPWSPQDSSALAAVSTTGARVAARLSTHLRLTLVLAVLFTLPRPVVDVAGASSASSEPLLLSSGGLEYGF
jgi:hypothetical protein